MPVQYGGGLRDMEAVSAALDAGAWRAVIGTAAFRDRALVEAAVAEFGDRIVVSADARDGRIAAQGWTEATDLAATDAVAELSRGRRRRPSSTPTSLVTECWSGPTSKG